MEIQKKTTDLLKKVLWTDTITPTQLLAAQVASAAIERNVTDAETIWSSYEARVKANKLSVIKKRKFQELMRELARVANRDVVHYCAAMLPRLATVAV